MENYFSHLHSLLIHKFYVFVAGTKLGCSFRRLVLHDLNDVFHYESDDFRDSRKKHDWRYWVNVSSDKRELYAVEIPEKYVYEMVADWMASLKESGHWFAEIADWYHTNKEFMIIHPATNNLILAILKINGYFVSKNKDLEDLLKQATRSDCNVNTPDDVISSACKLVGIDVETTETIIHTSDKLAGYCFWCNSYHSKEQPCLGKRNNW